MNGLRDPVGAADEEEANAPSESSPTESDNVKPNTSGPATSGSVPADTLSAAASPANYTNNDSAPSRRDMTASGPRNTAHSSAEAAKASSGGGTATGHAFQPTTPLRAYSNSAETFGVSRQPHRIVGFEQLNPSKVEITDSHRPMSSRQESRRSERAPTFVAFDKPVSSRGVQTSAPAIAPVAASCTRHPPLRCFSHLATYDRFVVPEDSFTDKCGRGKLIGTRPPRPGSTSSGKYERLPPHIRSLMNFRQEVIHPAVLRVGIQMGQRKIVGANARTAAMLTAFQRFIEDYSPPPYQAIDKHLKQMLDRQINFITHCRPHSIAMGGTIRWLKRRLSNYAALQLEETRSRLSLDISNFIAGRLVSATWMAASIVEQQLIENGDNVMVFGRSTAINCALLQSKRQGLQFSVVMVDAPHSVSGQATAKEFAEAGIYVTYTMLNGLSYHIRGITKVLLGCAALLANGYVVNSAGAATVAMMGKMHAKPVLVVTETYKMSDRVMLNSSSFNELADPSLVWKPSAEELGGLPGTATKSTGSAGATTSSGGGWEAISGDAGGDRHQQEQQQHPRCSFCQSEFQVPVVNPTYDVTPAQFIDYVVTEDGVFPASSIPAVICGLGKSPALAD